MQTQTDVQFILFGNVMTDHSVWFHDKNLHKINFVDALKTRGNVIVLKPNYVNFMRYSKLNRSIELKNPSESNVWFNIEDLSFENYSKWVFDQIDKNKKFIVIGLDQGCHMAKHFSNEYSDNCIALYVLMDRNFTKESYEEAFHSNNNYDFIKSIVGVKYKNYFIENLTNDLIHDLLKNIISDDNANNEDYINLLNGLCKGIIRKQYDKVNDNNAKMRTIIYSNAAVLTPIKYDHDRKISNNNHNVTYYYVIPNTFYLIHDKKYQRDILDNILATCSKNDY